MRDVPWGLRRGFGAFTTRLMRAWAVYTSTLSLSQIGGSVWESNPPGTGATRPPRGFEDREDHQAPSAPMLRIILRDLMNSVHNPA